MTHSPVDGRTLSTGSPTLHMRLPSLLTQALSLRYSTALANKAGSQSTKQAQAYAWLKGGTASPMNYYSLRRYPKNHTQIWISIPTVDFLRTAARAAKFTFSRASAPKSKFIQKQEQSKALQNQHTRVGYLLPTTQVQKPD